MTLYNGWPQEQEGANIKRDDSMRSVLCSCLASESPIRRPFIVTQFCRSSREPTVHSRQHDPFLYSPANTTSRWPLIQSHNYRKGGKQQLAQA